MRKMIADMLPVAIVLFLIISVLSVTEETFIVGNVIRAVHSEPELDINIIQPYIDLANNEKIVPYLKLTKEEEETFFKKIMELETGKTISWDKFKGKLMLTYDDIREIWLQRIVLILYNEIHNTFNWKILSYNDDELKSLLEFCVYDDLEYQCSQGFQKQNNGNNKENDKYKFRFVVNDNPLEPLHLVHEMFVSQNKLPEEVISPEQALELLARWMNENNWQHAYKGNLNLALSYNMIGKTKQTTSHSNREFLQATLRAMNIPSENLFITDKENAVHGGILFPTLNKGLFSTDDIAAFPNKYLPLETTLIDENVLRQIEKADEKERCNEYGKARKKVYITFLTDADKSIVEKYFCVLYPQKNKGSFFFEKVNNFHKECSGNSNNLFVSNEMNFWENKIEC